MWYYEFEDRQNIEIVTLVIDLSNEIWIIEIEPKI